MRLREVPRLYRRAILIYLATIVAPACGLLWLGLQSFERQRQALRSLTAEKLAAALEARTREAAALALETADHSLARHHYFLLLPTTSLLIWCMPNRSTRTDGKATP